MMFFELFVPKGTLDEERRRRLAQRLITDFMTEEETQGAPAAVLESSRAIEQVVVHEPDTWVVGGRLVEPDEPPRYVVRVSVPEDWREQMGAEIVSRVTRVLAACDDDPQRLYAEPHAWVHVVGIPEGSCGAFGQVMRSTDIVRMVTEPQREAFENGTVTTEQLPPDMALDPVCGMTTPLAGSKASMTLEYEGTTYAFCSDGCREVFVQDHPAAASATAS